MNCEICGNERAEVMVILPIKQADGRLNTMACDECAQKSSAYCLKHQTPHLGFADDESTACQRCIEEMVVQRESDGLAIFGDLMINLPAEDWNRLLAWAGQAASITRNTVPTCILRAVVTKALRLKVTIDEVMRQLCQKKSVEMILPKE